MSSQPNIPKEDSPSPSPNAKGEETVAKTQATSESASNPEKEAKTSSFGASCQALPKKKKSAFGKVVKLGLALALSLVLTWYMLSKVNLHQMRQILEHGVEYKWLWGLVIFTILSHAIRGYRWGYQLREININLPLQTLCVSIFGAYALNLVIPYIGEAWRIVFAARRGHQSITKVVGTDGGDRISDFVVIVALLIFMLFVAHSYLEAFLEHFKVGERIMATVSDPWTWIILVGGIGGIVLLIYLCRHQSWMKKTQSALCEVWAGFAVLFTMKHKWIYFWCTIGIWFCYFMKVYICFFAFSFTRELVTPQLCYGLLPGLVAFVFGSMSMAIPSNGGLGPWNIAVIFGLSLFAVGYTDAAAFAMVVWGVQALTLVFLGIYSAIYVSVTSKKAKLRAAKATASATTSPSAQPVLEDKAE